MLSRTRLTLAGAVTLAVAVAAPASALAHGDRDRRSGGLDAAVTALVCAQQVLSQSLLPFGDDGWYTPVDNAGFEGRGAWSVVGGGVVYGNQPWRILGWRDRNALRLHPGGHATSADVCVTVDHTHGRFFARSLSRAGELRVDVLWEDQGVEEAATVLTLGGAEFGEWRLTPNVPIAEAVTSLTAGAAEELVALRLTAAGGPWEIDDVLVDPYRRK